MGKTKKRRRSKGKIQKLFEQMGVFDLVLPCFQNTYVCKITHKNALAIQRSSLSEGIKKWFLDNANETFDEENYLSCMEEDTGEVIDEDSKGIVIEHTKVSNETVSVRRISMLTIMKGKHYPNELSSFVQAMYSRGQAPAANEFSGDEGEDALSFHQWVVCHSMVDPKVLSLKQVTDFFRGGSIDKSWFNAKDFDKLKELRKSIAKEIDFSIITQDTIRELSQFREELWNAHNPADPEKLVEVWWVEDFASDIDLVHVSGAAFNGPGEEGSPNVKPFSE